MAPGILSGSSRLNFAFYLLYHVSIFYALFNDNELHVLAMVRTNDDSENVSHLE